jgi:16S rRNA U1498 N3-methylase RsmE
MSNKEIVYWKQSGGNLVSIDDMDINHLRNVLKMTVAEELFG